MHRTGEDPIKLTSSGWWMEIDGLQNDGKLSGPLGCMLKGLIGSHLSKSISPTATPALVKEAKEFLQGGIELSDSAMDNLYDVMLYVPNEEKYRQFFILVRKYPKGRLKYLDEI